MKQTIAIVGLGLIGGSLALALKKTGYFIIGIDRNPDTLSAALAVGAIDKAGEDYLPEADTLILALSPRDTVNFLEQHIDRLHTDTLVTDVCGIKRAVMERCVPLCRKHGLHFIGGHPMAGKECSGFANADPALFRGASYILTPPDDTPAAMMNRLRAVVRDIGCSRVTVATPDEHDRMIAFTSQLPHVLAGAYIKSPRCPHHKGFSAGSYRDVSRVAGVDEELWTQLFLFNGDNLCEEIDTLIANLSICRDAIASCEPDILEGVLREARLRKERDRE